MKMLNIKSKGHKLYKQSEKKEPSTRIANKGEEAELNLTSNSTNIYEL